LKVSSHNTTFFHEKTRCSLEKQGKLTSINDDVYDAPHADGQGIHVAVPDDVKGMTLIFKDSPYQKAVGIDPMDIGA